MTDREFMYPIIRDMSTPDEVLEVVAVALDQLVSRHAAVAVTMHAAPAANVTQVIDDQYLRDVWRTGLSPRLAKRAREIFHGSQPRISDDALDCFAALCQIPLAQLGDKCAGQVILAALPMVEAMLADAFHRAESFEETKQ